VFFIDPVDIITKIVSVGSLIIIIIATTAIIHNKIMKWAEENKGE